MTQQELIEKLTRRIEDNDGEKPCIIPDFAWDQLSIYQKEELLNYAYQREVQVLIEPTL